LREKPCHDSVCDRGAVNVAPLQFAEEVARIHPSSTWTLTEIFEYASISLANTAKGEQKPRQRTMADFSKFVVT